MVHTDNVEDYEGSLEDLAIDIGNLKYDALAKFLKLLSYKIEVDSIKDGERNRVKLAKQLHDASLKIREASHNIDIAWKISEKYM